MKKHLLLIPLASLCFLGPLLPQDIRQPAVAGIFYDGDPQRLASLLEGYLAAAEARPLSGDILALIVPHAGYPCSGPTAALGYRQVKGSSYDAVVIIGPSHYVGFEGCSIYPRGGFKTPLGTTPVDAGLAEELIRRTGFGFMAAAHEKEHSLEVQVPFIQKVLPGVPIVPVVMGGGGRRTVEVLAEGLDKARIGRKILVVASTDLSHQFPKQRANRTDAETIRLIEEYRLETLFGKFVRNENAFCGGGAVLAALLYARKAGEARVEVLGYTDSSETCGPKDAVVGYMAAALTSGAPAPSALRSSLPALSPEEQKELLQVARLAVDAAVKKIPQPAFRSSSAILNEYGAAFVTLTKKGVLRGCIGFIEPVAPLITTVAQAAILAALEDRRFNPVSERELRTLSIEISLLSPLTRITNPRLIQVGRHGLVISRGDRRGLLLPRVATDNGWGREEFLRQACLKAGLPSDAWKKGADMDVFEALVIR